MTDRVLELLRTRPDLAELAAYPFNFDIERAYHVEDVHLASGASLEPIAGDDTGGTYFLCGGTAVLHASSDGYASLLADSVSVALEILVRLPWWCEDVSADLDEEGLLAAVREGDIDTYEESAPEIDAQRRALIAGLGLPDRPLTELHALSEAATRRTEPDHLLLNSDELCAYQLEERYRQPLRDIVLAPGRAALERMRSGDLTVREEVAADPVLRAGVLRAATAGQITDLTEAVEWARAEEGRRPEDDFTWVDLAHRQGRIENARVALIRMLDDTGPDADRLRRLSRALERLGDHAQAARGQVNLLSLQDSPRDRASEASVLARLERHKGDLPAAARALEKARTALDEFPEGRRLGLGRLVTEQHLELTLAAAEAGHTELARTTMGHARRLLATIAERSVKALSALSTQAKWTVARLPSGNASRALPDGPGASGAGVS
ncbi:hypothetical protein [Streptomyces sp. NPDC013457]|uniref:hypothetical protein n=1 Tax=Streptomyces sp. NPDC013457 TaxID=3364866 RepID=UPI0036F62283